MDPFKFTDRRRTGSTLSTVKDVKARVGSWIAEFIGTFFLVLFIKLTGYGELSFLGQQYGIGFGLLCLVYQFFYVSGAQFNPCVLIGLLCRGPSDDYLIFPLHDYTNIIMYLVAQFSGGLLGAFFAWGITNTDACSATYPYPGTHLNGTEFQPIQALGAEFLFTFLLVFMIINVAASQQQSQFYGGLCYGWTVFVAIGCIGPISGCSLNIAVWFSTIVSASMCANDVSNITWKYAWVYILGDILGAVCAGLLFRFLFISHELRVKKLQKLLAELIGTFFLVCIVKLASYTASVSDNGGIIAVETIGIGLIILTYLFGYISGAHFNPSVSLGLFLTDENFTLIDFLSYITVQIIGGTIGGLFVYGIGGKEIGQIRMNYDENTFTVSQAFFAELAFTFFLVNTILNVATSTIKKNKFYGLAIGSCLGTAVCAVGINGISGACLNLAVWFGTTVSALIAGTEWSDLNWNHLWIYIVAPFVGATLASLLYKYLYQDYDLDSETAYAGEKMKHQLRRYVAEFIGTAYLVLIIKLVSASYSNGFTPSITACVGVGFGLISLIYQFGYISQAHFNPAITIGVWLHSDIDGFEFEDYANIGMYIMMQLLGGFIGGLSAWGIGGDNAGGIYPHVHFQKEDYQVFGAEFIFTFLLVLITLVNITLTNPGTGIPCTTSGISVAWTVMSSIGAIGSLDAISGCCLNPAVWFGTIMSAACVTEHLSSIKFDYVWVYVISELLAGCAAGLFVRYLWKDKERRETPVSKYISEAMGTFFLVSFIKLSLSNPNPNIIGQPVLAIGFGYCILVYCFGCISGAHLNPAVSLSVYCRGYIEGFYPGQYMNCIYYMISQCLGGLIGGIFVWGVSTKAQCRSVYPYVDTDKLVDEYTDKAFGAEYIFTFLLASCVLHSGIGQQPNDFYGMNIGFVLFAAVQLIGKISGACLNPAVWFGTIVSAAMCVDGNENSLKWGHVYIYLAAPFLGAITAGVLYKFLYYELQTKKERDLSTAINEPDLNFNIGDIGISTRYFAGSSISNQKL
eukprot:311962_1